ncbi:uncharacterized protein LOC142323208 [Lycorma delicatula]|uniref:uncharacterized protein LOC142323208 n=1 Tax=Lycorma delicatula TaxID=130591 RepID=UPI003F5185C3
MAEDGVTLFVVAAISAVKCRPEAGGYTSYPLPVNNHLGGGAVGGGYEGHSQAPIVQKHIYVHVPPPDPEYQAPKRPVIPPPPPKKHYKIVFIKAPSFPSAQAPVIPAPQSDIEKTLIYVLHKNPTDAAPIIIPTPKPTQPAKPEVYFIRYKTNKELPSHDAVTRDSTEFISTTLAPRQISSTVRSTVRQAGPTTVTILPRSNSHKHN